MYAHIDQHYLVVFAAMAAHYFELPGVCETGLGVYLAAGGGLAKRDNRIHIEQDVLDLIDSIPHTQLLLVHARNLPCHRHPDFDDYRRLQQFRVSKSARFLRRVVSDEQPVWNTHQLTRG